MMIKLQTVILIVALFIGLELSGQSKANDWMGKYSYELSDGAFYTLTIDEKDNCTYEGTGIQTFFKVACKVQKNGGSLEIYYIRTIEGAFYPSDWMDKKKPIMTLFYEHERLLTDEGQLNKEVKGGQLLYKKIN